MPTAYLDYAATAPVLPEVRRAVQPFLGDSFGNPSSAHGLGLTTHEAVEHARAAVAALIGASPEQIILTSSGTESINLALQGVARARAGEGHLITSGVEHPATLETARYLESQGWQVTRLPVDSHGLVDPDDLRRAITPRTVLASVMHANNEVGTIQPIAEIGRITRERGVLLHVDAVQSAGRTPVQVDLLGADLLSISAHKLGGLKGTGALYVRPGTPLAPLIQGGGQEWGLRSGTENVAGIVGLGAAAEVVAKGMDAESRRVAELRDRLAYGLIYSVDGAHLNGHPTRRLPGFAHLSFEGLDGHWLVKELSRTGIYVATGSACSSGKAEPSHVLAAMGVQPELARGSLRLTLGWASTADEVRLAITVIPQAVERLRARAASGVDLAAEYSRDCRTARDRAVGGFLRTGLARLMGRKERR